MAAALFSAVAAVANVRIAYINRRLKEIQAKQDTLVKFISQGYLTPHELIMALNVIGIIFNKDTKVIDVHSKVRTKIASSDSNDIEEVLGIIKEELSDLCETMYNAIGLKNLRKMHVRVTDVTPKPEVKVTDFFIIKHGNEGA